MNSVILKALVLSFLVVFKSVYAEQALSVTLKADAPNVYVNAELILTVELKTALALRNGSLGRPEIKDAVIETLVEDEQQEIEENGVTKKIYKRVYAVFPAKPGKLVIPSVAFEGVVIKESPNNFFPGFFSNGQRINAQSNALSIAVKDVPSSYPKGHPFLPLKRLEIADAFDEPDPKFEVNKATTRRFEIKALGNLASSIPTFTPPRVKGIQIYAEAGEKIQHLSAQGIDASISLAHVYLPYEAGPVQIPEQKFYWWDTTADQLKTVIIKPLKITVEGVANAAPPLQALPPQEKTEVETNPEAIKAPVVQPKEADSQFLWLVLSIIFAVLWLITLIALLIALRHMRRVKAQITGDQGETRFNALLRKAKEECDQKDGKKALNSLSAFYRTALNEGITKSTAQNLSSCLLNLEDALYRYPNEQNVMDALRQSKKALQQITGDKNAKPKLAPLYPN